MARRKRGSKRRGKTAKDNKGSGEDWSNYMSGVVWKLFAAIPFLNDFVSSFQDDPSAEHLFEIRTTIGNLVPELQEQSDLLDDIRTFLISNIADQNRHQAELLGGIKDLLENYRRPDIFGQLAACSTLGAAVKQIKRLADQAESMASSLKGIDENLRSRDARGDDLPIHIHSYVRMMIEISSSDEVPHYFTVFNKSSQWHPKFADLQRRDPLGPLYLGHKTDLDELCAFLAEEVRSRIGPTAILHILMPTMGQLSLEEAVKFPQSMHPFLIEGELGDAGTPFVYICTTENEDKKCLRGVGVLKPREIWAMTGGVGIPLTPLCVSTGVRYFVDPTYKVHTDVGLIFAGGSYGYCGTEPPRTLGQRIARPWL